MHNEVLEGLLLMLLEVVVQDRNDAIFKRCQNHAKLQIFKHYLILHYLDGVGPNVKKAENAKRQVLVSVMNNW